jgi:hypothetical protein
MAVVDETLKARWTDAFAALIREDRAGEERLREAADLDAEMRLRRIQPSLSRPNCMGRPPSSLRD